MKTNANSRYTVAVLIDGDNASFERMEDIMGFVSRYGDAVVRRIYGDWTSPQLASWKTVLLENSIIPMQHFPHGRKVPGSMDSGLYKLPPMFPERTRRTLHWS